MTCGVQLAALAAPQGCHGAAWSLLSSPCAQVDAARPPTFALRHDGEVVRVSQVLTRSF